MLGMLVNLIRFDEGKTLKLLLLFGLIVSLSNSVNAQRWERDLKNMRDGMHFNHCIAKDWTVHLQSQQLVWNRIENLCADDLLIFYCFSGFSTQSREICSNGGVGPFLLRAANRVSIGLAPYDQRNEFILLACDPRFEIIQTNQGVYCKKP